MRTVLALAAMIALPSSLAAQPAATITGIASVADGDGIRFGDVEIRLNGIAAPEDHSRKSDPGGPEARERLRELAYGKTVRCELNGDVTPGRPRPVGVCFVGDVDLGRVMVREGLALDCLRYSRGRYAADEAAAVADGNDLAAIYTRPSYC